MALQQYTDCSWFVNGALLMEATSIQLKHTSGKIQINTMKKGLAGFSPGTKMVTGTIVLAVPRAGMEIDVVGLTNDDTIIEFVGYRAGKKVKYKGVFAETDESYGVDKAAEATVNFIGGPVDESTF